VKLVIKRASYEDICGNSNENFKATAARYMESLETGYADGEVHLVLCFDEAA